MQIFSRASDVKITINVYDENEEFYCKIQSPDYAEKVVKVRTSKEIGKAVEEYVKEIRRKK